MQVSLFKRLTAEQQAERNTLERLGERSVAHVAAEIVDSVLASWQAGRGVLVLPHDRSVALVRLMTGAMVASHLMGRLRALRNLQAMTGRKMMAIGGGETPYDQSVVWSQHRLGLNDAQVQEIEAKYGDAATRVTRGLTEEVEAAAKQAADRIVSKGMHVKEGMVEMRDALAKVGADLMQPWLLETLVRTQIQTAYGAGRWNSSQDPDVADLVWGYRYVTVGDDRVREEHAALDGVTLAKDDPKWDEIWPPNGFNSIAGWVPVSGTFVAASKANYSGPLVEIKTVGGARLAVTVNHPICTCNGMRAAGDIHEGDYLIAHLPSVEALISGVGQNALAVPLVGGRAIDNQKKPPTIQDLFNAMAREGVRTTLPGAGSLDFHGDARFFYGEVDVVRANGHLPDGLDTKSPQCSHDGEFMDVAARSLVDAAFGIFSAGRAARFGDAANLNAMLLEAGLDGTSRGVVFLRQLQERYSGEISLDKVTSVEIRAWSGHVFDLQSPYGWIVAGGLFVSNCRCEVIEETDPEGAKPVPEEVEIDGQMVKPEPDKGWAFNPGKVFPPDPPSPVSPITATPPPTKTGPGARTRRLR